MHTYRTLLGLAAAVALGGGPAFADEPHAPPASAHESKHDTKLKVMARLALSRDPTLGPLKLEVDVRDGVAVVRGAVPSAATAERARQVLTELTELLGVRSELRVVGAAPPLPPPLTVPSLPPPPAVPKLVIPSPRPRPEAVPTRSAGLPAQAAPKSKLPVATYVSAKKRSEEAARPADLAAAVAALRESNPAYRAVPVRVVGDVVIVSRRGDDADVAALAQALRRVPGVAEVVRSND